jgi:hypothetical protein
MRTASNNRLTARICGGNRNSLYLLSEIAILVNQLRDLLLKAIVLLHKKLIHGRELSVDSLQTTCLLALFLSTSSILEPDFDLLGLDVGKDWTFSDELLATEGAGLGAVVVEAFQSFHLFRSVPNVLARFHSTRLRCHYSHSHSSPIAG